MVALRYSFFFGYHLLIDLSHPVLCCVVCVLPPSLPPSSLQVVYEDGDCEELELREVREVLVAAQSVSAEKQELLRGYGRSMTARAAPSDFSTSRGIRRGRDTSSGRGSGKKAKKSEEKVKKKKGGGGKRKPKQKPKMAVTSPFVTSTPPPVGRESDVSNSGILAAAGGETLVLQEPVDTYDNYVSKTFFGFGVFYGLVVSCQMPFYKVSCW
jgi:hypothetical protein